LEFLVEDLNDPFNGLDISGESLSLSKEEVSVFLEGDFGVGSGGDGGIKGGLSSDDVVLSNDKVVLEFGSINLSGSELVLEEVDLLFGFLLIGDGISSGSNFVLGQVFEGLSKVEFEFVKLGEDSVDDGNSNIFGWVVVFLENLFSLFVVNVVITEVSSGFIKVSIIDVSELEELVHLVFLEEGGISCELAVGWEFLDLNKSWLSGILPFNEVLSQESDSIKSFKVFSESGDEDEGGLTSFIREIFNELSNRSESTVDPSDVISSVLDFSFDEDLVGLGS